MNGERHSADKRRAPIRGQGDDFVVRVDDASWPVRSASRLVTLSMMVAASAADDDSDRLSTVAHRYMSALVEHLTVWGRSMCDGPDGLMWATIQLGLLVGAREVIESSTDGTAATKRGEKLREITERYSRTVRRYAAAHDKGDH